MRSFATIIASCWTVFWLYWIVSAFGSKKGSVSNIKQFFGMRIVILVLAATLALIFNQLPHSFKNYFMHASGAVLALGLAVFLLGMIVAVWARIYLGRNWGMPMTQKQNPQLVTTGPYHYIRHPIYSGLLLMAIGSAIDVNIYWLLVFIIAAIYFIYSAVFEERLMNRQFPKAYPPYKSRTKMLIPFIL